MSVTALLIQDATLNDVPDIVELDLQHSGEKKLDYWQRIVTEFSANGTEKIALVARDGDKRLRGFLFGEVRAWEFGSQRCGWIFSVAVDPGSARQGIASRILDVARERFAEFGVQLMRTMVRRDDLPMASFFRSHGFVAGPYAEMEKTIRTKHKTSKEEGL